MAATEDTEITLGTGRLLSLFFGVVIVCAVFFGLGYFMGRSSLKSAGTPEAVSLPPPVAATAKPVAAKSEVPPAPDCAANPEACPPASGSELTFYKSVEQNGATTPLTSDAPPVAAQAPAPEVARPMGSGYVVQVAAVSKQEDAEALVSALRKKQYPVFVAGASESDKLFHVQVGPFTEFKEAEAMRSRLMGDGYNPIVKR
jgi:cell division septation protein DedD